MKLTIVLLREHGLLTKQTHGFFRFQYPACGKLRLTVNSKNKLTHCFNCGENFNNIDPMMI